MNRLVLVLCASMLLTACAATESGPSASSFNVAQQSAVTMTLKIRNAYKPGFQPTSADAVIFPAGANRAGGGFGQDPREGHRYKASITQKAPDDFTDFLLFVPLPPGEYVFAELIGQSMKVMVAGAFIIPFEFTFRVPPHRIVYLGRLEAVNRERRTDQERRAGPVMPLVDQAASGFSGGTFDIILRDNAEEDFRALTSQGLRIDRGAVETVVLQQKK